MHSKTQPSSLLNYGDIYEEDLKIEIQKTTSKYFLNISFSYVKTSCMLKMSLVTLKWSRFVSMKQPTLTQSGLYKLPAGA